jgi:hypothetical protein
MFYSQKMAKIIPIGFGEYIAKSCYKIRTQLKTAIS